MKIVEQVVDVPQICVSLPWGRWSVGSPRGLITGSCHASWGWPRTSRAISSGSKSLSRRMWFSVPSHASVWVNLSEWLVDVWVLLSRSNLDLDFFGGASKVAMWMRASQSWLGMIWWMFYRSIRNGSNLLRRGRLTAGFHQVMEALKICKDFLTSDSLSIDSW